jgi:hypothetical protein
MQLSTIVLALAASASAAVLPRDQPQGSWHIQLTKNVPKNNLYLTAKFTSAAYPDGLRNACVEDPSQDPVFHRCDHAEFDFSYDGECKFNSILLKQLKLISLRIVLNLTQNVQLPTPQTVFGSAYIPLTVQNNAGDAYFAEQAVLVTSAIA